MAHLPSEWARWKLCIGSCRANTLCRSYGRVVWFGIGVSERACLAHLPFEAGGSCASVLAERTRFCVGPLDMPSVSASVLSERALFARWLSLERYDMWLRSNRVKPAKAVVSKRLVPHKFGESSGAAEVALFILARVLVAIRGGAK